MRQIVLTIYTLLCAVSASWLGDYEPKHPLADNSTYGNIEEIHTKRFHLHWNVDFDRRVIGGTVTHDLRVLEPTRALVLDAWDISVLGVREIQHGAAQRMRGYGTAVHKTEGEYEGNSSGALDYKVETYNSLTGATLVIDLGSVREAGEHVSVAIRYETSPTAQAFSWLNPSQTAGGKLPYVFTQCEDINCRSVAPLQDTPANRITYSAQVMGLNALSPKMSANETGVEQYNATHRVTAFTNDIPIPSYLLALAMGDLEYRSLGSRVGVITEPSQMEKVATELEDMGDLLDAVERYMGPYIWGNYTIIVLPPSFPMGGMENPLLTFASPTIIVGDKSQVYVATHEMAHSWTGNEVTCRDWESFWLNEGFTVFIERHVSGEIHGADFAQVEALLGNTSLWGDMLGFGLDSTYSSLHPVLRGDNPDNSFSEVPYEKGFQFLYYL